MKRDRWYVMVVAPCGATWYYGPFKGRKMAVDVRMKTEADERLKGYTAMVTERLTRPVEVRNVEGS